MDKISKQLWDGGYAAKAELHSDSVVEQLYSEYAKAFRAFFDGIDERKKKEYEALELLRDRYIDALAERAFCLGFKSGAALTLEALK